MKSLKSFLSVRQLLLLLIIVVSSTNAWGKYKANVTVVSSPSAGGKVYAGTSNNCSASDCTTTSDNASREAGGLFSTSGNLTFYLCNKPNSGYVFKGWATSESSNSGNGTSNNPYYSISVKGSASIGGGSDYTYYAIFARMAANTPAAGSTLDFDDVTVGESSGWQTIKINHAHAATVTLTQTGNKEDFFIATSKTATSETGSFNSTTEGTQTLYVKFQPSGNGLRTCTLTVSSNNGLSSLTYYMKGTGYNKPSITWLDGNDNELTSGNTTLSAGDVLRASCTTGQTLTYSDYNTSYFTAGTDANGNPILTVREDISGTINNLQVTANLAKNSSSYYAAYSESFSLNITNLAPQTIEWSDDISDLSNEDMPYTITLTAVAKNAKTGANSGQAITYTMADNESLSLSGNILTVRKLGGPIAITANAAGNENYAPASTTKYVSVINMTDPCSTSDNHSGGTLDRNSKSFDIYPTTPQTLTFSAKRSSVVFLANLVVTEYNASGSQLAQHDINYSDISTSGTNKSFTCNEATTRIRFSSEAYLGYSYTISNVKTTRKTTSTVSANSLDYSTDPGQSLSKSITITYSNIPVFLHFKSDEDADALGTSLWSVSTNRFGGCGKRGSQTVSVTFRSNAKGDYTDKLYVRNNVGDLLHTIDLSASVTAQEQFLDTWNIENNYFTTDQTALAASTTVGNTDFIFSVISSTPANIVNISSEGVMTFTASGSANIQAYQGGDALSAEFTTSRGITISKATPVIATNPNVATVHYLDALNNSLLSDGLATVTLRGVENTAVDGTFTWTNAGKHINDEAGVHQYSVTFTPADGGMYNTVTYDMPVTVERAEVPTLSYNNATVDVSRTALGHYKSVNLTDLITALPTSNPMQTADINYTVKSVSTDDAAFAESSATVETGIISNTAKTFYATEVGVYTITATSPQTDYYESRQVDFTITVNKLQPEIYFSAEDTVYNVRVVSNAAIAVCENETITTPTMRYTSSDDNIIKEQPAEDGTYNLIGVVAEADNAVITAHYNGNAYFRTAENQKTYIARAKFTPVFLIDGTDTQARTLNVGGTALASFHYCLPYDDETAPMTYDITPAGIIEYNPATRVITAVGPGSADITFFQSTDAFRYEAKRKFSFTVNHNATSLTLADQVLNTTTMYVGDALTGTLYTANTDEVPVSVTSSNTAVVNMVNGELKALSEGEATITFAMVPEGAMINKWLGCSQQHTIHVSKRSNTLTPNHTATTKSYGSSETIVISASNTDYDNCPVELEAVNNADLVVIQRLSGNSFAVIAKHTEGTTTLRASQTASNEYVAGTSAPFTFTVGKSNYHVPIDLNSTMYNDSYCCIKKEGTTSVSGSEITLGQSFGGGFDWDDKYVVFRFEGIPDKLTFDFRCYSIVPGGLGDVTNVRWYVQESADGNFSGNTWTSSRTEQNSYESVTIQLQPNTRYVKLCYGGNYSGQFKNIHISERSELAAAEPATTSAAPFIFESKPLGSDDSEQVFSIDWYNIDVVSVTSSDEHFSVAPSSFADYEDYGQQPVTVIYHRSMDIAQHNATITLTNGTQTQYIYVQGETTKKTATIQWHNDIEGCGFLMNPGETYPNTLTEYVAQVSNDGDYTITSDNESVISVAGNTITANTLGTATITVTYAGSGDFYPTEIQHTFTVTDDTKQYITWHQSLMGLKLSDNSLTLDATATSGGEITYSVADGGTSIVNVSGNTLIIAGTAGDTYLTATQAGGEINGITYAPISMTKRVHVSDPSTYCEDYAISNQQCTFASRQKTAGIVFNLNGPAANRLYFSAYHDKASGTFWDNFEAVGAKNYNPLIVEEYRNNNNTWEWHEIFNQTVNKETAANYSAVVDPTATKIRFSSNEEVTHHVSNISLRRRKSLTASETTVNAAVDCNVLFTKTLQISYSGVDILTATADGGFSIDKETLGEGCGSFGTEEITVSLTPTELKTYTGNIVITDGKNNETRLVIPVNVEAQPISQTIINFNPAATCLTTDDITLNAEVLSANPIYFTSSDESIARVDAAGKVTIVKAGEVTLTAHCDAVGIYAAAPDVARTIRIERVTPVASTTPAASQVFVPSTIEASVIDAATAVMTDDKGNTVSGTFAWADATTEATVGTNGYTALFTPDNTDWYNAAQVTVQVEAVPRQKTIEWTLADNSTFFCYESITLDGVTTDNITGDTVNTLLTYTSSDPEIATVNGIGTVIVNKAGTVTITASSAASGYWAAAEQVQRTITFERSTPIVEQAPKAIHISINQPLERSYFYNYKVVREDGEIISGNFVWDAPETVETEPATYHYAAHFVPTNPAYYNNLNVTVSVRVVLNFWTFENRNTPDNHSWDKVENWSNAAMPTDITPDVTVLGDLHIRGNKNLSSLLIDEGGKVTITNNAKVTVKYDSYESESGNYGDLIVEKGGKLTLETEINVHDFILRSVPTDSFGIGNSGQIETPELVNTVNGDFYFELEIPAQASTGKVDTDASFGFAVPFPVSIDEGDVARLDTMEDGTTVWNNSIRHLNEYAIAKYNSDRRAAGANGWRLANEKVLHPGVFYMLGVDAQSTRYRFRKVADAPLVADNSMDVQLYSDARNDNVGDQNWNAIANPNLLYSKTTQSPVNFGYVFMNGSYDYKVVNLADAQLPVGTPFFVQTPAPGTVTVSPVAASLSPRRNLVVKRVEPIGITFASAQSPRRSDRIYISASMYAEDDYQMGEDLVKWQSNSNSAKIWVEAYGKQLSVNQAVLQDDEAVYPLALSAPANGTYRIALEKETDNAELLLMRDGVVVWNLNNGAYDLTLNKGTDKSYTIVTRYHAPTLPTDAEQTESEEETVSKFVQNGKLYILRDGVLYDATGKKINSK